MKKMLNINKQAKAIAFLTAEKARETVNGFSIGYFDFSVKTMASLCKDDHVWYVGTFDEVLEKMDALDEKMGHKYVERIEFLNTL